MGINIEKCVGCGLCVNDCIRGVFELRENKAAVKKGTVCLGCGHCVSICPQGAISLGQDQLIESYDKKLYDIEPERLLNFMKFRRSVRFYEDREVKPELIKKIIEAGSFAPTAANRQMIRYIVLTAENVKKYAYKAAKTLNDITYADENSDVMKDYSRYTEKWRKIYRDYEENGKDGIFYKAPNVIITIDCEPAMDNMGILNCGLASDNMELMVHSLGLGACYVGFFNIAVSANQEMKDELGIGERERIASVMTIGYPAVRYNKTVTRNKPDITII